MRGVRSATGCLVLSRGLRLRRGLVLHAPQRGLDAVRDTWRKFVRPLVHRLVGDANCIGGGGHCSAEQFDGLSFQHADIEP